MFCNIAIALRLRNGQDVTEVFTSLKRGTLRLDQSRIRRLGSVRLLLALGGAIELLVLAALLTERLEQAALAKEVLRVG